MCAVYCVSKQLRDHVQLILLTTAWGASDYFIYPFFSAMTRNPVTCYSPHKGILHKSHFRLGFFGSAIRHHGLLWLHLLPSKLAQWLCFGAGQYRFGLLRPCEHTNNSIARHRLHSVRISWN